jgi:hypothetical protein
MWSERDINLNVAIDATVDNTHLNAKFLDSDVTH